MRSRFLVSVLFLSFLSTPATAQLAKFTSYGKAYPSPQAALNIQGVPKLGTSFTVSGITFPGMCTRKFCACNCCDCNDCSGSVLFLGVAKISVKLPGGSDLLVTPDVPLIGINRGVVTLSVPNQGVLVGNKFYLQRLDLSLKEVAGSQCQTTYRPLSFRGASEGVEGLLGL